MVPEGGVSLQVQLTLGLAGSSSANFLQVATDYLSQYPSPVGAHSYNVAVLAQDFARFLGYTAAEAAQFFYAGLFHDVGKMFVDNTILVKSGPLSSEEFRVIRLHPLMGYHFLCRFNAPLLIRQAALMHHERLDGKGYPYGIMSPQIPFAARLIAICDAFDAMTSTRPYRKRVDTSTALQELFSCSGTQFDGNLVEKFADFISASF